MNELRLLDWSVLSIGWIRGWISREDVIKYALDRLLSEEVNQLEMNTVMSLAMADSERLDHESIRELIERLVFGQNDESQALAMDKWRLIRLLELDGMPLEWNDKVTRLEEIMAEFGYPSEMRLCSRYRSSQSEILYGSASPNDISVSPLDEMQRVICKIKYRLGI